MNINLVEKQCYICKEQFTTANVSVYAYKLTANLMKYWACTYSCFVKLKAKKQARKLRGYKK